MFCPKETQKTAGASMQSGRQSFPVFPDHGRESRPRASSVDSESLAAELMPPPPRPPPRTVTVTVPGCNAFMGKDTDWSPPELHSDGEHTVIKPRSGLRNVKPTATARPQVPGVLQHLFPLDHVRPVHAPPDLDPWVLVPPVSALPTPARQVVYRDRSPPMETGHIPRHHLLSLGRAAFNESSTSGFGIAHVSFPEDTLQGTGVLFSLTPVLQSPEQTATAVETYRTPSSIVETPQVEGVWMETQENLLESIKCWIMSLAGRW